ncbi:hypothetical protein AVEN_48727-1 [Araneus ventricosus]|uniref:Uncharacterized protein n=1 Tax=Araneus ventricosus TaxID=182803 RepID=A0A4Y2S1S6_ARAVE|nr:hypothetical protein AVEN_48727-1 [Araneus ventricosus]
MVTLNETLFDQRLTKLLLILCENNWMTPISADKAKNQLKEVCALSKNVSKLKMYKRTERDRFWFDLLSPHPKPLRSTSSLGVTGFTIPRYPSVLSTSVFPPFELFCLFIPSLEGALHEKLLPLCLLPASHGLQNTPTCWPRVATH